MLVRGVEFDAIKLILPSSLSRDDYRFLTSVPKAPNVWEIFEAQDKLQSAIAKYENIIARLTQDHQKRLQATRDLYSLPDQPLLDTLFRCLLMDNESTEPPEIMQQVYDLYQHGLELQHACRQVLEIEEFATKIVEKYFLPGFAVATAASVFVHRLLRAKNKSVAMSLSVSIMVWPMNVISLCTMPFLITSCVRSYYFYQTFKRLHNNELLSGSDLSKRRSFALQSFVVTEGGRIGFTASEVQSGDKLFFFEGSRIPFLLREDISTSGGQSYSLQGDCYIHGLMNGGASNFLDLPIRDVRICIQ